MAVISKSELKSILENNDILNTDGYKPPKKLIFDSTRDGKFYVFGKPFRGIRGRTCYHIRFLKTGYETYVEYCHIKRGDIKDYRKPLKHKGYLGDNYKTIYENDKELVRKLAGRWDSMMHRCYCSDDKEYYNYGELGVRVCKRWKCFCNYYEDVQNLPGYNRDDLMSGKIVLDKDYLQKNCKNKKYSPKTCVWISNKDNVSMVDGEKRSADQMKTFYWESSDGEHGIAKGIYKFAREHNISPTGIRNCLDGKYTHHHKYKFHY